MLLDVLDDAHVLLIEAATGQRFTAGYVRELAERVRRWGRGLIFLLPDGTTESACWFLAFLEARFPVLLIDGNLGSAIISGLADRYEPEYLVDPGGKLGGAAVSSQHTSTLEQVERGVWRLRAGGSSLHPDLAVLLTTSGSTGSPKLVRLSAQNVRINAEQIVKSLGITPTDRGVSALPLFYSFGMSLVTSHALVGSPLVVTARSVIEDDFWAEIDQHRVTFLSGVPATFEMLRRLGFGRKPLPHLRALTQAGGRLSLELVRYFHDTMAAMGGQFFVMYGQTEASPRISCLPSGDLPTKLGSVGRSLAGGRLSVRGANAEVLAVGEVGEIFYSGPNVMMGYAEGRGDLALGSTHGPELATGDIGYLDDEGYLFLTGRAKRIAKLAGVRVSLDEIEVLASQQCGACETIAAVDAGERGVALFVTSATEPELASLRRKVARHLGTPPKFIDVRALEQLPRLSSGKVDYAALQRLLPDSVGH